MKEHLKIWVTWEINVKTILRIRLTSVRMAIFQSTIVTKTHVHEHVQEKEPIDITAEM